MPILTISAKALTSGRAWTPGWYLVTFDKMEDGVISASGKSNNYKAYFTDVKTGNETMIMYNDSEFLVAQMGELFAAAADIPLEDIADTQIDFDKIKGNQLFVQVQNEMYKKNPTDAGRLSNRFVIYQPVSQPPY